MSSRPLIVSLMLLASVVAAQPPAPPAKQAKPGVAGDTAAKAGSAERLAFDQERVEAQMNELEARMFRLAEALAALEPENSSRLRLALKYSREELITQQMKDARALLASLKLDEAKGETGQVVAKLKRLEDLLLSIDLDFRMQLERLRLMREIAGKLKEAIREEQRQSDENRKLAAMQEELKRLTKRKTSVDELIARQKRHQESAKLAQSDAAKSGQADSKESNADPKAKAAGDASKRIGGEQKQTRGRTETLAKESPADKEGNDNLAAAASAMGGSAQALDKPAPGESLPPQEQALAALEKEKRRVAEKADQLSAAIKKEEFDRRKRDQEGNRRATGDIARMTERLGESGLRAGSEIGRAGQSMGKAEGHLDQTDASQATMRQDDATEALKYALSLIEEEREKLLASVQGEVRRRTIEALTLMLEKQRKIRETTVALQPGVAKKSRPAIVACTALAGDEGELIKLADDTVAMIEETEFGIALPAALKVVRRQMDRVKGRLGEGDPSEPTVLAEKRIEADLESMLDAMKRMPASRPPKPGDKKPPSEDDREKELNRLLAELKLIRLLQVRINSDTLETDKERAGAEAERLSQAIRSRIGVLTGEQDGVRDTTEKLLERVTGGNRGADDQ